MIRPWLSTNLAISADGKTTSVRRDPSQWTSKDDHARLLDLRRHADALIVGRGTLETDRMTLTSPGRGHQPLRCVISRTGKISADHPLFQTTGGPIHLLITQGPPVPAPRGVTVHVDSLSGFLETLTSAFGVKRAHCEGGGTLIRAFAALDAIDEFHLTLAGHTVFGGKNAPTATGIVDDFLPNSIRFQLERFDPRPESGECFLTYRRRAQ